MKELKEKALICDETWRRITRGEEIRMDTAREMVKALGVSNLLTLLHPAKLAEFSTASDAGGAGVGLPDWEKELPLSGPVEASNGLKYTVWKLKHRNEDDRFARGKEYALGPLPTIEQQRMRDYLGRHSKICNRVRKRPRFPIHITSLPDPAGESWWVLDEWTPGSTLAEVLLRGPVAAELLPRMMREIAEGLKALHEVGVIRRELSPRFVILEEPDESVVLTDFELGKLLDADPTVSNDWPGDAYQANEVPGMALTERDVHVDLYSWGRILVHAATGSLPPKGQEAGLLEGASLLPRVRKITKKCLALEGKERPQSADEVIKAIRGWK